MRGPAGRLGNVTNPLICIEWILALSNVIGGLYLLSPVLRVADVIVVKSPLIHAIASRPGIIVLASFILFTSCLIIAGIVKRQVKWRSAGLFLSGLTRLYVMLAGIMANGLLPLTWLSSATILVITFYIWGRIRRYGIE